MEDARAWLALAGALLIQESYVSTRDMADRPADRGDRIELRGIKVFAYHGAMPEEQEEGQEFLVDVAVSVDLAQAGETDRLDDTIDYKALAERVSAVVAGERWDLLERVAHRVAEVVLEHDRATAVTVTIHKPEAPIGIPVEDVSVTIVR